MIRESLASTDESFIPELSPSFRPNKAFSPRTKTHPHGHLRVQISGIGVNKQEFHSLHPLHMAFSPWTARNDQMIHLFRYVGLKAKVVWVRVSNSPSCCRYTMSVKYYHEDMQADKFLGLSPINMHSVLTKTKLKTRWQRGLLCLHVRFAVVVTTRGWHRVTPVPARGQ